MIYMDPVSARLAALNAALQLVIVLVFAVRDRDRFLRWALLAWGLRVAFFGAQYGHATLGGPLPVWTYLAAIASGGGGLALLASALTYRDRASVTPARIRRAALVVAALAALYVIPGLPPRLVGLPLALVEVAAVAVAGVIVWPRARRHRGAVPARLGRRRWSEGILALSLLVWAGARLTFNLPLGPDARDRLILVAFLSSWALILALVLVVLRNGDRRVRRRELMAERSATRLPLGVATLGPDLRVQEANLWLRRRFGPDLVGRTCLEGYLARPEPCPGCPWRTGLPTGDDDIRELVTGGRDGRRLLLTFAVVESEQGEPALLEIIQDITERELLQTRLVHAERHATIGRMAAKLAHAIRTPLGPIVLHLGLVQRELPAQLDDVARGLRLAIDGLVGLKRLVEGYLRLGRLPHPDPDLVDLEGIVDVELALLAEDLRRAGVALVRERDPDLPRVWADPELVSQVVGSLVRNALEAMPGGGTLTVRTARAGDEVALAIADSGPGVPADLVEQVFTPFFTTKPEGTGLGLTIASQIAREHGGTLVCASGDPGATFTLTLRTKGVAP
jgi:signal transduction histidine kinase